jgi:hypothetical protein
MLALSASQREDMPQGCAPFATEAKGQTLEEKMVEGEFLRRLTIFA